MGHDVERSIMEDDVEKDGAEVEESIIEEQQQRLAARKYVLEAYLGQIEDSVRQKYPDFRPARAVVGDILKIDVRTTLRRRTALIRMKERALQLIEVADREIAYGKWNIITELDNIRKMAKENDARIKEQARKRRASSKDDIIAKCARSN